MRRNPRVEGLGDFLDRPNYAMLATNYADGTTLLSPASFERSEGARAAYER